MTEAIKGKTEEQAYALFDRIHRLLRQEDGSSDVGKLAVLAGVHAYPTRVKCATLAWHTLHAALKNDHDTVTTE